MKMKRTIAMLLLLALTWMQGVGASATGWYIKRNGNAPPILSPEFQTIERYDGYYIDRNAASTGEKVLYLTFDAGYENGNIEKILDVLRQEGVPGAFFVLSHLILKNTELVKRMQREGHLVCNHTKNHKDMTACSREEMIKNLTDLEKICYEKTGKYPAKYFRFPEGNFDEPALATARELGYKSIFWSLAYADWDNAHQPKPEKAKKLLLANTHAGAVVLLHPTSSTNAAILKSLIEEWRAMGYRFGTLDELTR